MPKKKIIKIAVLLLALWVFLDWCHLSGREIDLVDRLGADCEVKVERLFYVEIGKEGNMPITEMQVDRTTLTPEQIEQLRELIKNLHCRRTFEQSVITKSKHNGVKYQEPLLEYDSYTIVVDFGNQQDVLVVATSWGDYLQYGHIDYESPRFKIINDDWNSRMAEILGIEQ